MHFPTDINAIYDIVMNIQLISNIFNISNDWFNFPTGTNAPGDPGTAAVPPRPPTPPPSPPRRTAELPAEVPAPDGDAGIATADGEGLALEKQDPGWATLDHP